MTLEIPVHPSSPAVWEDIFEEANGRTAALAFDAKGEPLLLTIDRDSAARLHYALADFLARGAG